MSEAMFGGRLREYSMYAALVVIMVVFTLITGGTFLTARNLTNLVFQTSYIAVLAIGVVLIIIAGHTDLSIGSLTGLVGGVMAILQVKLGWSTPTVLLAGLLFGLLAGAWQGFWVAYRGVPAFIVTLAGMLVFRGVLILLTKGETIAPMSAGFKAIGQSFLPALSGRVAGLQDTAVLLGLLCAGAMVAFRIRERVSRLRRGLEVGTTAALAARLTLSVTLFLAAFLVCAAYRGVPYAAILLAFLTLILSFASLRTPFGRHVYAIGGNVDAARLSGIDARRVTFLLFVIMGALTAVSGLLFTARLDSATASAGTFFEFDAITAAVIGGASILGGEGSVTGAVVGALVMGSLNNGMGLMNVPTDRQQIIKGLILLLVVWFDIAMRKRQA